MRPQKLLHTIGLVTFAMSSLAATAAEPSLKEIMQDLRDNLVEITDGLLVDDFDRVAQGATNVAQHPHISAAQGKQIAAALGPEMPAFKQFDEQVHASSLAIASAASDQDRNAVIVNYHRMVDGCLTCHAAFKARVATALTKSP